MSGHLIASRTLPEVSLNTLESFYPYPVSSRSKTHAAILSTFPHPSQPGQPGPSRHTSFEERERKRLEARRSAAKCRERAFKRALHGTRPAGTGLGKELAELSDEEQIQEDEQASLNQFGEAFLLPYGRRQTQMEINAAPSPSPSDAGHDRRQEDSRSWIQNEGTPEAAQQGEGVMEGVPVEEEDDEGDGRDLDASMEDLDNEDVGEEDDGVEVDEADE